MPARADVLSTHAHRAANKGGCWYTHIRIDPMRHGGWHAKPYEPVGGADAPDRREPTYVIDDSLDSPATQGPQTRAQAQAAARARDMPESQTASICVIFHLYAAPIDPSKSRLGTKTAVAWPCAIALLTRPVCFTSRLNSAVARTSRACRWEDRGQGAWRVRAH